MRLVEQIILTEHKTNFKTRYIKYRAGRLKHQYWLWNRKNNQNKIIDLYDALILKNCKLGKTAFFSSGGYYLKDIWPEIDCIEIYPVVAEFYPNTILVNSRNELEHAVPYKFDNFAVVNNRSDHWVTIDGLTEHLTNYCKVLNTGARLFYSFRDTQIQYHRFKQSQRDYFYSWAQGLQNIGLTLVWSDIQFKKKEKDGNGNYDGFENPDTTNGNLKFWFVYKGEPWTLAL
jgi:hypothetical protein